MNTFFFKKLPIALLTIFAFALTALAQNVSVVSSGGAITSASYTTLKGAFDKIDSGFHAGVISITISGNTIETAPALLNASGTISGAYQSSYSFISITPIGGPWTVSGSGTSFNSQGLIVLDGADNVKIDGGASRNLIFSNAGTTSPAAIWLKSGGAAGLGCSNDTIANCQIKTAVLTAESYGVIASGYNTTSPAPTYSLAAYDCDNVLILNNKITNCYYGISASGNSSVLSDNFVIRSNEIGSDIASASIGKYGIYVSNMDSILVEKNKVYNVVNTTNVYGIYLTNTKSFKVKNNILSNISTSIAASAAPYGPFGIYVYNALNTTAIHGSIANNVISGVKYSGTEAKNVDAYGIYANKAQYLDITNNAISGVVGSGYGATAISSSGSTFGIFIDDATSQNINIYYNSINLFGAYPKATLSTYNISACVGLNNSAISAVNIVNNVLSDSLLSATGSTGASTSYAIYAASGFAFNGSTKVINYNDYYITGTGAKLALIGTTAYNTYSDWLASVISDANSRIFAPNYNTNTDLTLLPGSSLIGLGQVISGFGYDLTGVSRNVATPTIGAYENASDVVPPVISFTKLCAVDTTTNRVLSNVLFTDNFRGLDSVSNMPRLYYKKLSAANTYSSWQYVVATGSTKSATFTIDYSKIGGASVGDTIQYFIVSKDFESSQANISLSSGAFSSAQTSVALSSTAFPITGTIDNYGIASTFRGVKTVGTGGDYATLTGANGAFSAINSGTLSGDLTLKIISDISEPGTNGLNKFASLLGTEKVIIVSDTNILRTLSGNLSAVGLFRFINAKNVFIDGSFKGLGRYLSFVNNYSSTAKAATFHFSNASTSTTGCRNISIKNSIIVGPVNTSAAHFPIYAGDATISSALSSTTPTASTASDHDSITIEGNWIYRGLDFIMSNALSTQTNDYWSIKNNIIGASTNSNDNKAFAGIYLYYCNNFDINGNKLLNLNNVGNLIGIFQYFTNYITVQNNTINNLNNTSSSLYGLYNYYTTNATIYNNKITNLTNLTSSIYGLENIYTYKATITSNIMNTFNAPSSTIYAMDLGNFSSGIYTGDSLIVANNAISAFNSGGGIYAIYLQYGKGHKVINNSVHLAGTRPANTTAYCFNTSGSAASQCIIDSMYNNSFSVTHVNSGTGKSYCVYISSANVLVKNKQCDNNNYYAPTSATLFVGYYPSAARADITAWQAATGFDANSGGLSPLYMSDTLIVPSALSPLKYKGVPTSIKTDIVGAIRANQPTIGAYENTLDLAPPVIAFTQLTNTTSNASRTLDVNITDNFGTLSSFYSPRLFYKKSTKLNDSASWVYSVATGTYPNFTFAIDTAKIGGLKVGDYVQYFVAAQDEAIPANIALSNGCSTTNSVSNIDLPASAFPIIGALPFYKVCEPLYGVKTVGVGGDYLSLTGDSLGFFKSISNGNALITGDLTIKVISDLTENGNNALTAVRYEGQTWPIKVVPSTNTLRTISGGKDSLAGLIRLLNVKNFTIDGSYNNSGQFLKFANTVTSVYRAATVGLLSAGFGYGCYNDTVKNCVILGPANTTSSTFAIYSGSEDFATSATNGDNNNIAILNNTIYRGYYLIMSNPKTTETNHNWLIRDNKFGGSSISTENNSSYIIYDKYGTGFTIDSNNIAGIAASSTFYGMYFYYIDSTLIANNAIKNCTSTSSFYGMALNYALNTKIIYNTLKTLSSTSSSIYGFNISYAKNLAIENNTIASLAGSYSYGMYNMTYYSSSYPAYTAEGITLINNAISDLSAPAGASQGIYQYGGVKLVIINNSIHISGAKNTTQPSMCLYINGASSSLCTVDSMYNNSFTNIATNSSTGKNYAMYLTNSSLVKFSTTTCDYNNYYCGTAIGSYLALWNKSDIGTLIDWQTSSGIDQSAISVDPLFASNVLLSPTAISPLFGKGIPTRVTYDIVDSIRSTVNPTLGAYEKEMDLFGPVLSFSKINSDITGHNVTLSANIYDAKSGLDTVQAPRLYYKKSSQSNDSLGWIVSIGVGPAPNYTFLIDTAKLGGVRVNDNIQYFILARDLISPIANFTMSSGSASGTLSDMSLNSSNFPISGIIDSYDVLPGISGTITVGVGGNYLSFTGDSLGLFKKLSSSLVVGDLNIKVISNITESGTNQLNRLERLNGASYSVSILPDTAKMRTITGTYPGGLIRLQTIRNLVIDGAYNSKGSYLTFINNITNVAGATIQFVSAGVGLGCRNIQLLNSTVVGPVYTNATTFTIYSGKTILSSGGGMVGSNDSISIIGNHITGGCYSVLNYGNSNTPSTGWILNNNTFGDSVDALNPRYCFSLNYNNNLTAINNSLANVANGWILALFSGYNINNSLFSQNKAINVSIGTGASFNLITLGSSNDCIFDGNIMNNFTSVVAVNGLSVGGANTKVINNKFTNVTATNYNMLSISSATSCVVENNIIAGCKSTNASNPSYGFSVYSSSGRFANNSVFNIASVAELYGVYIYGSSGLKIYNNSIHLSGTSSAGSDSYSFFAVSCSIDSLYNNNFSNMIVSSATAGYHYAIYNSGSVFTNIDNNNYYSYGNARNVFGYYSTAITDLTSWQALTYQDMSSISNNPGFLSNSNLVPSISSPLLHAGYNVGVNTDIIGNERPSLGHTNPSIGCYEDNVDVESPIISFDAISNSKLESAKTMAVNITDLASKVNTTNHAPRLYYKKATDLNDSSSWAYAVASGTTPNFTFVIDYSKIGVIKIGDVINYFVVAEDSIAKPNVAIKSGFPNTNLSSVVLGSAQFPVINYLSYTIAPTYSGVKTVGVNGDFFSLTGDDKGVFKTLANSVVTGDLTLKIISDLSESSSNTLNSITRDGGDWKIKIAPDTNTVRTIKGQGKNSETGGIFRFIGVRNILIDGSNSGSGRYLTFTDSMPTLSNTTPIIQISGLGIGSSCSNITIQNSIIKGSYNGGNFFNSIGVYIGNSTIGMNYINPTSYPSDNDSINIINNSIIRSHYGIYVNGTSSGTNDKLIIKNNIIGSANDAENLAKCGVYLKSSPSAVIYGNEILNVIHNVNVEGQYGVYVDSYCDSSLIENNIIHGIAYTGSSTGRGEGIAINGASNYLSIINNSIFDINGSGNTDIPKGINLSGSSRNDKLYYNSVYLNGEYSSSAYTSVSSAALYIAGDYQDTLDVRNNAFINTLTSSTATSGGSYAVEIMSINYPIANSIFDYNDYYSDASNAVLTKVGFFGTDIANLLDWQIVTLQDNNSKSVEPDFYTNSLLMPTSASGLLSSGTPILGVSMDIIGDTRNNNAPTIGAYESVFTSTLPSVETSAIVSPISQHSATSTGTIISKGGSAIQAKGMVIDIASYPSLTNNSAIVENGAGLGAISANWSNLDAQRVYYVRAFATNLSGTSYGANVSFSTLPNQYVPAVTSSNALSITSSSAVLKGVVTNDYNSAITERGFIWNTTNDISITDYLGKASVPAVSGSYINAYSATLSGLAPSTTYYFRAFATNGVGTSYGSVLEFTTLVEGYTLSGTVSYAQYNDDPINTKVMLTKSTFKAMPKAPWVKLYNASGALVDSTTADAATGAFSFTKVVNGAYRLVLDTNMTWTTTKGYQLTLVDYKYIKEYVVSLVYLDSLQMRAANIDRSGSGVNKASITLSDAANLMQRIVGLANASTWKSSNYMYAIETVPSSSANHTAAVMNLDMTVVVGGSDKTGIIVRGLSSGDVNGQ